MASTLVVLKFDTPEGADEGSGDRGQVAEGTSAGNSGCGDRDLAKRQKAAEDSSRPGRLWRCLVWRFLGHADRLDLLRPLPRRRLGRGDGRARRFVVGLRYRQGLHRQRPQQGHRRDLGTVLAGRTGDEDRVEEAFKSAPKFEVIASNLSHEQEEKLKDAFSH